MPVNQVHFRAPIGLGKALFPGSLDLSFNLRQREAVHVVYRERTERKDVEIFSL